MQAAAKSGNKSGDDLIAELNADSPELEKMREIVQRELNYPKRQKEDRAKLRDCPTCGKPYYPTKEWQRFCSPRCRSTYHNDQQEIIKERKAQELEKVLRDYQEALAEITSLKREITALKRKLKEAE